MAVALASGVLASAAVESSGALASELRCDGASTARGETLTGPAALPRGSVSVAGTCAPRRVRPTGRASLMPAPEGAVHSQGLRPWTPTRIGVTGGAVPPGLLPFLQSSGEEDGHGSIRWG